MKFILIASALAIASAQISGLKTYGEYEAEEWDLKDTIAQNSNEETYLKDGPGKAYSHAVGYDAVASLTQVEANNMMSMSSEVKQNLKEYKKQHIPNQEKLYLYI